MKQLTIKVNFNIKKAIISSLILILTPVLVKGQIQKGQDIEAKSPGDWSGYTIAMSDSNTVAVGSTHHSDIGNKAGQVRIFQWSGNDWIKKGGDLNGEANGDEFGFGLSMPDANTLAVGAPYNQDNGKGAGHVRIFIWKGASWIQKGNDIDGEADDDNSGMSVCMPDSNTIAIGALGNDGAALDAGHVRIYKWKDSVWVQKGGDINGKALGDHFGRSISMHDSNTIAIGAPQTNINQAGYVSIYNWSGSMWTQKGSDIDGETAGDNSGRSVCMPNENTVAIGAHYNDGNGSESGHARIFTWDGSSWQQKGSDIDGESENDWSGYSISMPNGNTIAIGSPFSSSILNQSGQVRIFTWKNNSWSQKFSNINGEDEGDWLGNSVSMPDTNHVGAGAPFNSGLGNVAGHVRIYRMEENLNSVEINDFNEIEFYPNPFYKFITIDLPKRESSIVIKIELLDLFGRKVETQKKLENDKIVLSTSDLVKGVYVLQISDKKGAVSTTKIVKN